MCLNRNILECKSKQTVYIIAQQLRLNRNILECKSMSAIFNSRLASLVLIETYWNVNGNS